MIKLTDTHILEFFGYFRDMLRSIETIERHIGGVYYARQEDFIDRIDHEIDRRVVGLRAEIEDVQKELHRHQYDYHN